MPYKWRMWFHGLIAGILNAIGNSVVVIMVDPTQFNLFQGGAMKLSAVAAGTAVFSFFTYIKDHPLPDPDKDTDANTISRQKINEIVQSNTGDGGPPR